MKKVLKTAAALAAAMILVICSAAAAEGALGTLLARIGDAENPAEYTIATTEYDIMEPMEGFEPTFAETLQKAELTLADPAETPDGEYVVLNFPGEGIRFDFFFDEENGSYIRQVNADGSEELYRASMPGDDSQSPCTIMSAAADNLAELHGLLQEPTAELPEEGWLLDSVNGTIWMDDRATLEVILEDEGFKVVILWGNSAFESEEWTYACEYDEEEHALHAVSVIRDTVTYGENGDEENRANVYERDSEAVFALNADGKLEIRNAGDEALEGKAFERVNEEP